MNAQAELLAQWMLLGFVHGVMNTDNMTISGEGIDYGPCAFLDVHRRGAVFSSIDRGGRYAYGSQPGIGLWNLSRFAETLLPVLDEEDPNVAVEQATAVLEGYVTRYREAFGRGLAVKLGLPAPAGDELGDELFALLEEQQVDHTRFFRALADGEAAALFADPAPFTAWHERLRGSGGGDIAPDANPVVIPRNVHLDSALRAAHLGRPGAGAGAAGGREQPLRAPCGACAPGGPGRGRRGLPDLLRDVSGPLTDRSGARPCAVLRSQSPRDGRRRS